MGDIVGLVQDFEEVVDEREAEADAERLLRGRFGLDDLLTQLRTIQKLGPLRDVVAKLPMFGGLAEPGRRSELVAGRGDDPVDDARGAQAARS